MDVVGPYCVIYPKIIPQHLIKAIDKIQMDAAKYEFTHAEKTVKPSEVFIRSAAWRELRVKALEMYRHVCMRCGSVDSIQVDHIKPKSKYPALALTLDNLQLLCWPCNQIKSYIDETDYRPGK